MHHYHAHHHHHHHYHHHGERHPSSRSRFIHAQVHTANINRRRARTFISVSIKFNLYRVVIKVPHTHSDAEKSLINLPEKTQQNTWSDSFNLNWIQLSNWNAVKKWSTLVEQKIQSIWVLSEPVIFPSSKWLKTWPCWWLKATAVTIVQPTAMKTTIVATRQSISSQRIRMAGRITRN